MFKNYLKTAFRNLWKNKGFSSINIFGLAVGLTTCMLILFFVADETSFDNYNVNKDRIFRVDGDIQFGGNHFILAVCQEPMGPTLKKDFPAIKQYARFRGYGGLLIKKDYKDTEKAWLQKLLKELENEGFISLKKDVICFAS